MIRDAEMCRGTIRDENYGIICVGYTDNLGLNPATPFLVEKSQKEQYNGTCVPDVYFVCTILIRTKEKGELLWQQIR